MPPAARAEKAPTPPPPPPCAFPIGEEVCRAPSTHELPVGYASNSDPMPLCDLHARRFLGAATAISS